MRSLLCIEIYTVEGRAEVEFLTVPRPLATSFVAHVIFVYDLTLLLRAFSSMACSTFSNWEIKSMIDSQRKDEASFRARGGKSR